MFNRNNRTNRTTALVATTLAAGALVVLAAPETSEAAYNPGVESAHFAPCEVGWGFPCSLPVGIDEADVIRVKQTVGQDGYEFAAVDGTGSDSEHVWLNTEAAADCRAGYHVWKLDIEAWGYDYGSVMYDGIDEVDSWWGQGVPVPDANSMPETQVIVDMPVARILEQGDGYRGLTPSNFTEADLLEYGEDVIAQRIANGMSEDDARGLGFELGTSVRLWGHAICRGTGLLHLKYIKEVPAEIPLRIEYMPAPIEYDPEESDPPAKDQFDRPDDLVNPAVTDADLFVIPDEDDPCTLHLSGSISTNMPIDVEYRFVDPHGQPSNSYTMNVDQTQVGMFDRTVQVPGAPDSDPSDDLVTVDGPHGDLDDFASPDDGDDTYQGVYELEILWPNRVFAVDGFEVDYCQDHTSETAFELPGDGEEVADLRG